MTIQATHNFTLVKPTSMQQTHIGSQKKYKSLVRDALSGALQGAQDGLSMGAQIIGVVSIAVVFRATMNQLLETGSVITPSNHLSLSIAPEQITPIFPLVSVIILTTINFSMIFAIISEVADGIAERSKKG